MKVVGVSPSVSVSTDRSTSDRWTRRSKFTFMPVAVSILFPGPTGEVFVNWTSSSMVELPVFIGTFPVHAIEVTLMSEKYINDCDYFRFPLNKTLINVYTRCS